MAIVKIDNETIEITDAPPVRRLKIKELKEQKDRLQAQKAVTQAAIDELTAQIEEARLLGVE